MIRARTLATFVLASFLISGIASAELPIPPTEAFHEFNDFVGKKPFSETFRCGERAVYARMWCTDVCVPNTPTPDGGTACVVPACEERAHRSVTVSACSADQITLLWTSEDGKQTAQKVTRAEYERHGSNPAYVFAQHWADEMALRLLGRATRAGDTLQIVREGSMGQPHATVSLPEGKSVTPYTHDGWFELTLKGPKKTHRLGTGIFVAQELPGIATVIARSWGEFTIDDFLQLQRVERDSEVPAAKAE